MTVKNGQNTLTQTLDSLVRQTLENIEIVIVDDGSSDSTVDIVKSYQLSENRIKLIVTEGVGRSKALNIAVSHCKGDFLCNVDADDLFHPKKLELQLQAMSKSDFQFLCTGTYLFIDEPDDSFYSKSIVSELNVNELECIHLSNPINHSSIMVHSSLINEIGDFYNEELNCCIDYSTWLMLKIRGVKLYKLPLELTGKRIHKGQSFENKKRIKYLFQDLKLKLSYIRQYGNLNDAINVSARFFYGLLPQRFRVLLKKNYI